MENGPYHGLPTGITDYIKNIFTSLSIIGISMCTVYWAYMYVHVLGTANLWCFWDVLNVSHVCDKSDQLVAV